MGIFGVSHERVESLRESFTSQIADLRRQQDVYHEAVTKYGLRIAQIEGREEATRKFHESQIAELQSAVAKLSADLAEIDCNRKPLIEIVESGPRATRRRSSRGRMGPHKRLGVLGDRVQSGELPRDLFDSAKQTVPLAIIALYECTGGYNLHKRGLILQDKPTTGLKPFGVSVDDHTTRGTKKDRRPYQRTAYYATWNEREQAKAQLNAYHELCRAYYSEKGRKP